MRCAVVSIVARGLTSGQKRPRGPRRATDVGIAASLRKDGSVGVDRFGFRVTCQTAGLTFVGMQLRFVRLRHSALHLSFLLVRLGGFAADYFRGHPSALRAERGASGSIDHQCDPREASRDDPGGISRNLTYCFLRLANLDNGVFERLGRYEAALCDRSCRSCLRSKRSDTDKSLLSQVGFWGHQSRKGLFVAQAHSDAQANAGMAERPSAPFH